MSIGDAAVAFLTSLPTIITLVIALGYGRGSYLRESRGAERVFQPPRAGIISLVTIVVWPYTLARFDLLDGSGGMNFLRSIPSHPQVQEVLLVNALLIAGLYWAALSWFQRRWRLVLNLDQRTWRSLNISKLSFRAKTGSWSELAGVQVVGQIGGESADTYYVQIKWKSATGMYGCLGKFDTVGDAGFFAAQSANRLRLPLLPLEK